MDINHIKALRARTGMGMLEVKKALHEANGNLEEAYKILMTQVSNQQSTRVASKGLTHVRYDGNEAVLFEVNAETDFASKHQAFIDLIEKTGQKLLQSQAITLSEAKQVMIDDVTLLEYIDRVSHLMKEHVYLRRFYRIKKESQQSFATYMHQNGKLSILVILDSKVEELGKNIAQHIASHAPKYLSYEKLDQSVFDYEKLMLEKEKRSLDTESFIAYIKSMCLLDQSYFKNPDRSIKEILKGVHVIDFYRFELGQGIENKLNCRVDLPCDASEITISAN